MLSCRQMKADTACQYFDQQAINSSANICQQHQDTLIGFSQRQRPFDNIHLPTDSLNPVHQFLLCLSFAIHASLHIFRCLNIFHFTTAGTIDHCCYSFPSKEFFPESLSNGCPAVALEKESVGANACSIHSQNSRAGSRWRTLLMHAFAIDVLTELLLVRRPCDILRSST